jgi:hypothetical protein
MTQETFVRDVWGSTAPNYLPDLKEIILAQRLQLANSFRSSSGTYNPGGAPDLLYVYALGSLLYQKSLPTRQVQELNRRLGADFCDHIEAWYAQALGFTNDLQQNITTVDHGRFKDYLSYLRSSL